MIRIEKGDITKVVADAIVNAANDRSYTGSGINGAMHRAAGPSLEAEMRKKYPRNDDGVWCPTGEVRTTSACGIANAKWIVHTVGPDCRKMPNKAAVPLLEKCYRECFGEAVRIGAKSMALPAISTGIFGFPKLQGAQIAVREAKAFLAAHPSMEVIFCCFGDDDVGYYSDAMNIAVNPTPPFKASVFTKGELDELEKLGSYDGRLRKTVKEIEKHLAQDDMDDYLKRREKEGRLPKRLEKYKKELQPRREHLESLAKKDAKGIVRKYLDLMDRIDASEKAGWSLHVLPGKWDAVAQKLDFSDYTFNRNAYEG